MWWCRAGGQSESLMSCFQWGATEESVKGSICCSVGWTSHCVFWPVACRSQHWSSGTISFAWWIMDLPNKWSPIDFLTYKFQSGRGVTYKQTYLLLLPPRRLTCRDIVPQVNPIQLLSLLKVTRSFLKGLWDIGRRDWCFTLSVQNRSKLKIRDVLIPYQQRIWVQNRWIGQSWVLIYEQKPRVFDF